jgi:hypothetical protein
VPRHGGVHGRSDSDPRRRCCRARRMNLLA